MNVPTNEQIFRAAQMAASSHEDAASLFDDLLLDKALRMRDARDHREYMRHKSDCEIEVKWWESEIENEQVKCTCGLQEHLDRICELLSICK